MSSMKQIKRKEGYTEEENDQRRGLERPAAVPGHDAAAPTLLRIPYPMFHRSETHKTSELLSDMSAVPPVPAAEVSPIHRVGVN